MTFTRKKKDGSAIVKLHGALTVYEAAAIRDELLESLDAHTGLTVDLTDVNEIDVTGVQILHAAGLAAANEKKSISFRGASARTIDVIKMLGLEPEKVLGRKEYSLASND